MMKEKHTWWKFKARHDKLNGMTLQCSICEQLDMHRHLYEFSVPAQLLEVNSAVPSLLCVNAHIE
jgi:hypothetical protein